MQKMPLQRKSSEEVSFEASKLRKLDPVSPACVLNQVVQVSPFLDKEKIPMHVAVEDSLSDSQSRMCLSHWYTSNVPSKQIFDKQQAYQAHLCQSTLSPCSHYALHGFRFCVKHILQDPLAPYKQCDYFQYSTQARCSYPVCINVADARFCQLHKARSSSDPSSRLLSWNNLLAFGKFSSIMMAAAVAHEFTDEMCNLLNHVMPVFQADQGFPSLPLQNISGLKYSAETTNKDCQGNGLGFDLWSASSENLNLLTRFPPSLKVPKSMDLLFAVEKEKNAPFIRAFEGDADTIRSSNKTIDRKLKNMAMTDILHANEPSNLLGAGSLDSTPVSHMWTPAKWQDYFMAATEKFPDKFEIPSLIEMMVMDTTTMGFKCGSDRGFMLAQFNEKHKHLEAVQIQRKGICLSKCVGVCKCPWGEYGVGIHTPGGTLSTEQEAAHDCDVAAHTDRGASAATYFDESADKHNILQSEDNSTELERTAGKKDEHVLAKKEQLDIHAQYTSDSRRDVNTLKEEKFEMPTGGSCDGERDALIPCGVNMAAEIDGTSDQELEETSRCLLSLSQETSFNLDSREPDSHGGTAVPTRFPSWCLTENELSSNEQHGVKRINLKPSGKRQPILTGVGYSRTKKKFKSLASTVTELEVESEYAHDTGNMSKILVPTVGDFPLEHNNIEDGDGMVTVLPSKRKIMVSKKEETLEAGNCYKKRKRGVIDADLEEPKVDDDKMCALGISIGVLASSKKEDRSEYLPCGVKEVQCNESKMKEDEGNHAEEVDVFSPRNDQNGKTEQECTVECSQQLDSASLSGRVRRRKILYGFDSDFYVEEEYSRVYKTTSRQRASEPKRPMPEREQENANSCHRETRKSRRSRCSERLEEVHRESEREQLEPTNRSYSDRSQEEEPNEFHRETRGTIRGQAVKGLPGEVLREPCKKTSKPLQGRYCDVSKEDVPRDSARSTAKQRKPANKAKIQEDVNRLSPSMEESLEDSRMDCLLSCRPEKPADETVRVNSRHRPAYRGVYLTRHKFQSSCYNPATKKHIYLGTFPTAEAAARAYDKAALKISGRSAQLNFPLRKTSV